MKKLVTFAAVAAALAVAAPASAQQRQGPTFGVGISIFPINPVGPTVEVYVPIGIAPNFRIEPSLGIFTEDADPNEESDVTLGVGAFFVQSVASNVDMYAGGRLKLNFASVDTPAGDDSDTDLSIAAALGAEYYFVPKFSIGLEAQLGLYQLGDVSGDADGFFTNGLAFLRMYF